MSTFAEREEKNSKIILTLTRSQCLTYEKAALLNGQTLEQWAIMHLNEAARYDFERVSRQADVKNADTIQIGIEQSRPTILSDKHFELFCQALDEPMPKATQDLLSSEEFFVTNSTTN